MKETILPLNGYVYLKQATFDVVPVAYLILAKADDVLEVAEGDLVLINKSEALFLGGTKEGEVPFFIKASEILGIKR